MSAYILCGGCIVWEIICDTVKAYDLKRTQLLGQEAGVVLLGLAANCYFFNENYIFYIDKIFAEIFGAETIW